MNECEEEGAQGTRKAANHLLSLEGMLRCWEALVEFPLMLRAVRAARRCLVFATGWHFILFSLEGFPNIPRCNRHGIKSLRQASGPASVGGFDEDVRMCPSLK